MSEFGKYYFTVGELTEILKQFPEDMPVVVSGYKTGYENFFQPYVVKVSHFPENMYFDGEFQLDENGEAVLVLERVGRCN